VITVGAKPPEPYVHADNRGLVLCNGYQSVLIPASQVRACAETFAVVAEEGRAIRTQAQHVVGGFKRAGEVVIYAGTLDQLLSVTVAEADFTAIREAILTRS
jgi:hypothetical protein